MLNRILCCVLALVLFGYSAATLASPIGRILDVKVDAQQAGGNACTGYRLTPKQARIQLERSIVVTRRVVHDYFDWGDCVITGTLRTSFEEWTWQIRQGGVTQLESPHGDIVTLADPKQVSSLDN